MGEALPGHTILNPWRKKIQVTQKALRAMDKRNFLRRDQTGLLQVKPELFDTMAEMEYGTALMRELGPDCSGPNVPICTCRECRRKESDIDHTLTPEMHRRQIHEQADAAIRTVKVRRAIREAKARDGNAMGRAEQR